jgi:hypothetical protein
MKSFHKKKHDSSKCLKTYPNNIDQASSNICAVAPSSSGLRRGLLKNRMVVQMGACIAISSGLNVDVWNFFWIPLMPNFKPIPNANLSSLPSFSVANLILERECSWNSSLLVDLFHSITVQRILSIRLPQISSFDKWTWASFLEIFFVKSVHEVLAFFADRPSPLSKEALSLENRSGYLAFSS